MFTGILSWYALNNCIANPKKIGESVIRTNSPHTALYRYESMDSFLECNHTVMSRYYWHLHPRFHVSQTVTRERVLNGRVTNTLHPGLSLVLKNDAAAVVSGLSFLLSYPVLSDGLLKNHPYRSEVPFEYYVNNTTHNTQHTPLRIGACLYIGPQCIECNDFVFESKLSVLGHFDPVNTIFRK